MVVKDEKHSPRPSQSTPHSVIPIAENSIKGSFRQRNNTKFPLFKVTKLHNIDKLPSMAVHGGFTPKNITTDLTADKTDYVEVVGSNAQFTQPYRTLKEEEIEMMKIRLENMAEQLKRKD